MDFMCRTCMERNKKFVNIFEYKEKNYLLSDMLFECTSIRIEKNDGLPLHMCSDCLERLTSAWDFRVMVNEIHSKLHTIINRSGRENLLQHSKYIDMTIVKEETSFITSETCNLSVQENVDINSSLKLCTRVKNICRTDKSLSTDAEENSNSRNYTNIIHTVEENSARKEKNSLSTTLVNINTMKKKLYNMLSKDDHKNKLDNKVIDNLINKNNISFKTCSDKESDNSILSEEKLLKCSKERENNTLSINRENQNSLPHLLNINQCSNENTSLLKKSIGLDCNIHNIENIKDVMKDEPKQNHLQSNESEANLDEILLTDNSPNNIDECTDIFDSHDDQIEQEKNEMEADTKELALHSENRNKKLTKKEKEKMSVFCETCNRSFGYRYYFEIHVRHHSGDKQRKCNICGKAFVRQFQLRIHMAIHSDARPFSCEICGKTFKVLSSLNAHKFVHSDTSYFCNICQKRFKNKILLKSHIKRHGKTFTCEVCGKSFSDQSSFYKHKIVHVDEKKFACPTCEKTFKTKQNLREHLKSHSEARPYSCSYCGKGFKTKEVMDHHVLIHTGERPFSCRICDKSFRQSSTLYYHMRIHTGETPYACELCPSQFKYSHHLQNHMKGHK